MERYAWSDGSLIWVCDEPFRLFKLPNYCTVKARFISYELIEYI